MNRWKFQPARDLELHGLERHRSLLRESGLAASMVRLGWCCGLRLALPVWHRLEVTGREHLPAKPPFVLVSNHTSHLDTPILASLLPAAWRDRVFPVAAWDTFFEKLPAAAFADWCLNALPIRRHCARTHDLDEMRAKLIRDAAVFIIFPEGTRSRTGEMQSFHGGIGRLIAGTPVPVVPCYLDGCFRAWPSGSHFIKPVRVTVRIGRPLRFDEVPDHRAGWDGIASQLGEAVAQLALHRLQKECCSSKESH
jgi:1-acyl-sn-glycerol-3-phosphate acyltransferase